MGQYDDAIACFRKAVELDPTLAGAHYGVGHVLTNMGQPEQAMAFYRRAIELAPKVASFHEDLGWALETQGRFDEAIACFQKAIELDPELAGIKSRLARVQRMAAAEKTLSDFLKGDFKPATGAERLLLAEVCFFKKRYRVSAGLYAAAFAVEPALADGSAVMRGDPTNYHLYAAAMNAALAAAGKDEDPPGRTTLDDKERARLRKQALDWLRADLAFRSKQLESGQPADRAMVQMLMNHWRQDRDLAAIRDSDALAKLPAEEQNAFTQLWADVAALLQKATGPPSLASLIQQLPEARSGAPQREPATGRIARADRPGPPGAEEVDRGRAAPPRVPGHPRADPARRVVHLQHQVNARRRLLGQERFADAEPLLLTGYEGMKQREKTIPQQSKLRLPEAARAPDATLRRDRQEGRGLKVAEGVASDQGGFEESGGEAPIDPVSRGARPISRERACSR